jgi:hypothetical protein
MKQSMTTRLRRLPARPGVWLACGVTVGLAVVACGGGSGGVAQGNGMGQMQVQLIDGPDMDASQVWLTLTEIWVHPSATAEVADSGWQKLVLPSPVTLDMNTLSNGALSDVLGTLSLPVGSYQQMRLMLAAADDPISPSAQALGLKWNDQVNYVTNGGVAKSAPIEIAQNTQGMTLFGSFDVTDGGTLKLAIEFDVGDDLMRFKSGGENAFTLSPTLKYFDLNASGAITGQIDTSACAAAAPNPCSEFVVKAETPSADGSHYQGARWTAVAKDGRFALYPVRASGTPYHVVMRGRYAETMIVQNVPVIAGTAPDNAPTVLSATPLAATSATEFNANLASGVMPTGASAHFYQTVGGSLPYDIRNMVFNPFTGTFTDDLGLTDGMVMVGAYVPGGTPLLTATVPAEGLGTYQAMVQGWGLADANAGLVSTTGDGTTTLIAAPTLQPGAKVAGFGQITGTLAQGTPGKYNSGYLVVVHGGMIENSVDISSALQANGGVGGDYLIDHIPVGDAAHPLGQNGNGKGIYYALARVWNSATPTDVKRVWVPGFADLDATNSATLNATLP